MKEVVCPLHTLFVVPLPPHSLFGEYTQTHPVNTTYSLNAENAIGIMNPPNEIMIAMSSY